tara:strand:- start:939 stop:1133 length:195 start_codon:yes stop_codon:yes gene_type:complete
MKKLLLIALLGMFTFVSCVEKKEVKKDVETVEAVEVEVETAENTIIEGETAPVEVEAVVEEVEN